MDNRSKLLHIACKLFSEKGYDAVGVQEIVLESGVTKPTLYHYFGSKEGLLQAILEHGFAQLNSSLDIVGEYHFDLPGYLERQAKAWILSVEHQPDFFRLNLSLVFLPQEHAGHKLVLVHQEKLFERMHTLFAKAALEHGNMKGREKILALNWIGSLHHWTSMSLLKISHETDSWFLPSLRQFLYGVFT